MELTSDELDMLPMMLRMELEENLVRKDYTISEKVKIARIIEPYLKKAAKDRQTSNLKVGGKKPRSANFAEREKGDSRKKIADVVGISHPTLSKATEVVATAEKEPEIFGHLVKNMDSEKISVNQAFNAVKREEQKEYNAQFAAAMPSESPNYDIRHDDNISTVHDDSVDLILTDPPYNISAGGKVTKQDGVIVQADFGDWDSHELSEYLEWLKSCFSEFHRVLKDTGSFYVFLDRRLISFAWDMALGTGLIPKNVIVWRKTNPVPQARRNYASASEFVLYGVKYPAFTFNPKETNLMHNVVDCPVCAGKERTIHPTQKPVRLLKHFIEISSNPGDTVLDCFAGSGSVGATARELNRNFILVEKDTDYINLIKARLRDGEA